MVNEVYVNGCEFFCKLVLGKLIVLFFDVCFMLFQVLLMLLGVLVFYFNIGMLKDII